MAVSNIQTSQLENGLFWDSCVTHRSDFRWKAQMYTRVLKAFYTISYTTTSLVFKLNVKKLNNNNCIHQQCVKLIKSDSKGIYNVTEDLFFKYCFTDISIPQILEKKSFHKKSYFMQ